MHVQRQAIALQINAEGEIYFLPHTSLCARHLTIEIHLFGSIFLVLEFLQ